MNTLFIYRELAETFATNHLTMSTPHDSCDMDEGDDNFGLHGGITNGAAWYSVAGGELNLFILT